jgi:hypothetical protein
MMMTSASGLNVEGKNVGRGGGRADSNFDVNKIRSI